MSSQVNKAALKTIDKAIRAVERKIHFYSEKRRNAMLEYAASDMAEAYQIGAEEAQGEFLARLQTIRRSMINADAGTREDLREGSQPPTPLDVCSTTPKGVSE